MYWGLLWKSSRPSKRQRRPLIWGNAFGEVYLEIYQDKGIPLAKVSENSPTITNPEQRAGQSSNSVMNALSGLSSFQKVRYRGGFIRSLFKGERDVWDGAAPTQVAEVDLNDMYQAS
jgi:hypothetical protein